MNLSRPQLALRCHSRGSAYCLGKSRPARTIIIRLSSSKYFECDYNYGSMVAVKGDLRLLMPSAASLFNLKDFLRISIQNTIISIMLVHLIIRRHRHKEDGSKEMKGNDDDERHIGDVIIVTFREEHKVVRFERAQTRKFRKFEWRNEIMQSFRFTQQLPENRLPI